MLPQRRFHHENAEPLRGKAVHNTTITMLSQKRCLRKDEELPRGTTVHITRLILSSPGRKTSTNCNRAKQGKKIFPSQRRCRHKDDDVTRTMISKRYEPKKDELSNRLCEKHPNNAGRQHTQQMRCTVEIETKHRKPRHKTNLQVCETTRVDATTANPGARGPSAFCHTDHNPALIPTGRQEYPVNACAIQPGGCQSLRGGEGRNAEGH